MTSDESQRVTSLNTSEEPSIQSHRHLIIQSTSEEPVSSSSHYRRPRSILETNVDDHLQPAKKRLCRLIPQSVDSSPLTGCPTTEFQTAISNNTIVPDESPNYSDGDDQSDHPNYSEDRHVVYTPTQIVIYKDLCRVDHGWNTNSATTGRDWKRCRTPLEEVPRHEGMQLGDFIKIMQIGQGAYGDVWLAEDIKKNRLVALKKLKLNEEREGFPKNSIREISLLRYLRHPNIVGFFGMVYSRPRLDSLKPILPITSSSTSRYGFRIPHEPKVSKRSSRIMNHQQLDESQPTTTDPKCPSHDHFEGDIFPIERHRQQNQQTQFSKSSVWMVFEYMPFDLNGAIEQLREEDKRVCS